MRAGPFTLWKSPMPKTTTLRPIEFHQLCAIARTVLQSEPTINDSDWKDRTKTVLSKQGYGYPSPDMMARALVGVEHAIAKTMEPRPVTLPTPAPRSTPPQQQDPPWKRPPIGWTVVARMIRSLSDGSGKSSRQAPVIPLETLAIAEGDALNLFYAEMNAPGADKLHILRVFAEIAIVRPASWDAHDVRAKATQHSLHADGCAVCCGGRALQWHHVLQVQFGGSNTPRNRIALCEACHASIHPWLGAPLAPPGWTSIGDMAAMVSPHSKAGAA